jgi:hypothetical protein
LIAVDFNRDGKLDLAVADDGNNAVDILLGNGDGTFQPATQYLTGSFTWSLAAGDFDGDGLLDLVVPTAGGTAIYLGNGDGTFRSLVFYATAPNGSVIVLDANNDGVSDLVIAGQNMTAVKVLLGNGDGTFGFRQYASDSPLWITGADFRNNGRADLIAANWNNSTLSVFLNNGDGTFQPKVDYTAGSTPNCVAAADFNGDGKLDLAVSGGRFSIGILLGNGDGSFQPDVEFATTKAARMLAVDDFNNDHKQDLVGAIWYTNSVMAFLGNGDATFQAPTEYSVGPGPVMIATGDLNGDGNKDLIVANSGCVYSCDLTTSGISILFGNGDGTFQPAVNYITGLGPQSVSVGDFNHDNHLDIAVFNEGWGGSVSIFLGNGDGTFQPRVDYPAPLPSWGVVADVDGDGNLDLVAGGFYNGAVALGNSDGTFQPFVTTGFFGGPLYAGPLRPGNQVDVAGISSLGVAIALNRPAVALWPTSFNFATVNYGNTSSTKSFLVSNPSPVPLQISNIAAVGDFAQTNTCGGTLAAGSNCSINADFSPTQYGSRSGGVLLHDAALSGSQGLFFRGFGAPAIHLSTQGIDFGIVRIGHPARRQVVLTNLGGLNIPVNSISFHGPNRGDFTQTNTCANNIAPFGACTITLTFSPTRIGSKIAAAAIYDGDILSPRSVVVRGLARLR